MDFRNHFSGNANAFSGKGVSIFQKGVSILAAASLPQQHVAEVRVRGIGLQLHRHAVLDARGALHLSAPLLVAAAVGEHRDLPSLEAADALGRQAAAAAGGQPQVLRPAGCHHEGRLLALHQAHMGIGTAAEQVLAEQALVERPPRRQHPRPYQRYVRPALKAAAVAVGAILHDVARVYPLLLVNLPEDHAFPARGANEVVIVHAPQLLLRQAQPRGHVAAEPPPEGASRRPAAHHILHRHRLERGRRRGRAVAFRMRLEFPRPRVVTIIIARLVVVAAGVLVVALAHAVGHIAQAVPRVHVAHEALRLAAMGAAQLAGLMPRKPFALQLVTIVCIHET